MAVGLGGFDNKFLLSLIWEKECPYMVVGTGGISESLVYSP